MGARGVVATELAAETQCRKHASRPPSVACAAAAGMAIPRGQSARGEPDPPHGLLGGAGSPRGGESRGRASRDWARAASRLD